MLLIWNFSDSFEPRLAVFLVPDLDSSLRCPKKWLVISYFFYTTLFFRNYSILTSVYSFTIIQYCVILIKFALYLNQNKTRNVFKFQIYVRSYSLLNSVSTMIPFALFVYSRQLRCWEHVSLIQVSGRIYNILERNEMIVLRWKESSN